MFEDEDALNPLPGDVITYRHAGRIVSGEVMKRSDGRLCANLESPGGPSALRQVKTITTFAAWHHLAGMEAMHG